MTPSLLLLRHAESEWNAVGRWQGLADPPLSPAGEAQAAEAAGLLARDEHPFTRIVASDLRRARQTAEAAGAALGLPVEPEPRLRERDAGPWQGLTRVEIEHAFPGFLASGERPEGWEPDADLLARVLPVLLDLEEGALVVCHGGVISTLGDRLADDRVHVANVTGRWLTWERRGERAAFAGWPAGSRARASAP